VNVSCFYYENIRQRESLLHPSLNINDHLSDAPLGTVRRRELDIAI
jgi:hypothetical protein